MASMIHLVNGSQKLQYSTKETAQFIRRALKATFPNVKFSVTTSYGSCYSATDVRWTDGPTQAEVELITERFTSRGFDGMTDSTTYHDQVFNGQRVKFSGHVNVTRRESETLMALAAKQLGHEYDPNAYDTNQDIYRRARHLHSNGVHITLKEGR